MEMVSQFRTEACSCSEGNGTAGKAMQKKRKWRPSELQASLPSSQGRCKSVESVLRPPGEVDDEGPAPVLERHPSQALDARFCEDLQARHEHLQHRVAAARRARRELCTRREALIARNTATAALSARAVGNRRAHAAAHNSAATLDCAVPTATIDPLPWPPSRNDAPVATVSESNRRPGGGARSRTADQILRRGSAGGRQRNRRCPDSPPLAPTAATPHTVYTIPSSSPRKITPATRVTSLSFQDLLEASGSCSERVDFSRKGMLAVLAECEKAQQLRWKAEGAPSTRDVCRFVQLGVEAAPGLDLSLSTALRSPECIASAVLYYLLAKLEGALMAAALEAPTDTVASDDASVPQQDSSRQPSPEARTLDSPSHFEKGDGLTHSTRCGGHGDTAGENTAAPTTSGSSCCIPAQHAQHELCCDSVAESSVPPAQPPLGAWDGPRYGVRSGTQLWSGAVRCGVNESASAQRAVWHSMRALVGRFCGALPAEVLQRVLDRARTALGPIASFFVPGHELGLGWDSCGGEPLLGAQDGVKPAQRASTEAATGVLALVFEAYDHLRNPDVLRALGSRAAEGGRGGGGETMAARERRRAHVAAVMLSACHVLTLRDAPRTVRRLSVSGILPNFFEHKDLHIALFQKIRLSPAQNQRCSEHWHAWQRHRSHLDKMLQRAVHALPCTRRSACAIAAVQSTLATLANPTPACAGTHGGCSHLDAPLLRFVDGVSDAGWWDGESCTGTSEGWGMWSAHTAAVAELLLGASVERTAEAGEALAAVHAVHASDASTHVAAAAVRTQPGALLEADQIAHVWAARAMHGPVPVDILEVCQLAALHQSRERTFEILRSCVISDLVGCDQ